MPIGPIGPGVNDPAVDRRGHRRGRGRRDRYPLFRAAIRIGRAERLQDGARDRQGHLPLGFGESDRRLEPRGIRPARRGGPGGDFGRSGLVGGERGGGAGLGRADLALHFGDQIFETRRLAGKLRRARAFGAKRALRGRQRLLAGIDQIRQPRLVDRQFRGASREIVALLGDRGPQVGKLGEIRGQRLRRLVEIGDHGVEHDRGANGLGHVMRFHKQRRRRVSAHPLQYGQQIGDLVAPAFQRGAQRVRLRVEFGKARVRGRAPAFVLLDFGRGLDQGGVESGAIDPDRLDIGLDLTPLLFRCLQRVLDAAKLHLLGRSFVRLCRGRFALGARGGARRPRALRPSARRGNFSQVN